MVPSKLKTDLKKFAQLRNVDDLKKQLAGYEKRVLEVVREVDLKGREARRKGEAQITRFASQIRERRSSLEKQLRDLVSKERDRLNEGIGDLLSQLRKLSKAEQSAAAAAVAAVESAPAKPKATKRKSSAKKTTTKRANHPRKKSGPTAVSSLSPSTP